MILMTLKLIVPPSRNSGRFNFCNWPFFSFFFWLNCSLPFFFLFLFCYLPYLQLAEDCDLFS